MMKVVTTPKTNLLKSKPQRKGMLVSLLVAIASFYSKYLGLLIASRGGTTPVCYYLGEWGR